MIAMQKVAFKLKCDFSLQIKVLALAGSISEWVPVTEMLFCNPGCMGEQQMPFQVQMHLRPAQDFANYSIFRHQ